MPEFGDRVKALRKDAGLSRPQAAELLGYSRQEIWRWEHGKRNAPRKQILRRAILDTLREKAEKTGDAP